MHRDRVNSSNLHSVGYDGWSSTLEIKFHSGGIYQYSRVPYERYERLMNAGSKGSYFHYHIKHSFAYRRVG
jgi:hypothetical protein